VSLFQLRLEESEKSELVKQRIEILLADFTEFIYVNICRGLFEDHKLLFSFLVAARILRHVPHAHFVDKRPITPQEWTFFLRGIEAAKGLIDDKVLLRAEQGRPAWIAPLAWRKLDVLERLTAGEGNKAFERLTSEVVEVDEWRDFVDDDKLYERPPPGDWGERLTAFEHMLLVKCFAENCLQLVVRDFVQAELGESYTAAPRFDLAGCFEDSQKTMPLIFILSAGADPTAALLKLAAERNFQERLHFISLGQGQGTKAEKLINDARENGDWVCLQNCHLAASWMPALERIQEAQDADKIDDTYRLWLTSMPSTTFPVPVLQNGIKITNEPAKGLRANLSRTFQDLSPEIYEGCQKGREFKKLLFSLAFFHAAILERRTYGPIGWNIPYEWMESDFQVSREQVCMYLESQPGVPWKTLTYIIADVNYGGRVTDDKDVRLISAFLARYFNEGVLTDGYKFCDALDYYVSPDEGSLEEVREYVRQLPKDDDPQIFGLHPNALITAQSQAARRFLDAVVGVQPRLASGGTGKSPQEIVAEMAEDFLRRMPDTLRKKDAHAETYKSTPEGGIVSLGVFHSQETDRFNELIVLVRRSLVDLGKAIKGLVVMSSQLEDIFNAFLVQKIPPMWNEVAYPCLKPLNSWVRDFEARIMFIKAWLRDGPPTSFWVPCFYFPQGFMTASMQVYARKTKIPIDALTFWTEPTDICDPSVAPAQEKGVNIHGLFIQGVGWDLSENMIAESEKGVLFFELPVIWLNPLEQDELIQREEEPCRYRCPVYKTSERKGVLSTTGHSTNFVTYLQLPSDNPDQGHWVRRGVALLCMLDD